MRTADDLLSIPIHELEWAARRARSISELEHSSRRAAQHLRSLQRSDGHWCGELEGNSILESEYLLLLRYLGRFEPGRVQKAAEHVRRDQGVHGGWSIFPGGPPDVSTSIKAYFALKLCGDREDASHMLSAKRRILDLGGIDAANSFTKIYLAIFGQYEWERCPAIPPEMILLPDWFPLNIYEMSSWSRVMVVPLSVIWAHRPVHPVAPELGIAELASKERATPSPAGGWEARSWRAFFQVLDRGLRQLENVPHERLRMRALALAERWILDRTRRSAGIGAIFPPIVNTIYALSCLGYAADHPVIRGQLHELEKLAIETDATMRVQPCTGAVWDTALALVPLMDLDGCGELERRGVQWLLDREVSVPGDWRRKCPEAPISGWSFQSLNELNPDCDDTAQVLLALARAGAKSDEEAKRIIGARSRGIGWLLAMQNDDGGWGAFDKGCTRRMLTFAPFADHNAMIDPSTEDITGRVLDALNRLGLPSSHPAIQRAVRFLEREQEPDGSWFGRWGCNYLYGTYLALTGLAAVGEDMKQPRYQRSGHWLRAVQNADGGWGESFDSYDDPRAKATGESTAAQTAWALLGLFATGDHDSQAVETGIQWLLHRQHADGGWRDGPWTGTGFPKVFYLRYDYYDDYFPLLALTVHLRYQESREEER